MSGHRHNPTAGTQNQGNSLGDRSCVRQSRLYRQHEGGNNMKAVLGTSHLAWDADQQQGAYQGRPVFDHNRANPLSATCSDYDGRGRQEYGARDYKEDRSHGPRGMESFGDRGYQSHQTHGNESYGARSEGYGGGRGATLSAYAGGRVQPSYGSASPVANQRYEDRSQRYEGQRYEGQRYEDQRYDDRPRRTEYGEPRAVSGGGGARPSTLADVRGRGQDPYESRHARDSAPLRDGYASSQAPSSLAAHAARRGEQTENRSTRPW